MSEIKRVYIVKYPDDDICNQPNEKHLRGHWIDRLPAIDQDIQDMLRQYEEAKRNPMAENKHEIEKAREILSILGEFSFSCEHRPLDNFQPGMPLAIRLSINIPELFSVKLHYRHVNQAEEYSILDMQRHDNIYMAIIPASYTDSPYPLQYFFQVRNEKGLAGLYPGFNETLSNQPYYVIQQYNL